MHGKNTGRFPLSVGQPVLYSIRVRIFSGENNSKTLDNIPTRARAIYAPREKPADTYIARTEMYQSKECTKKTYFVPSLVRSHEELVTIQQVQRKEAIEGFVQTLHHPSLEQGGYIVLRPISWL
jgi:hypothetical protein